MPKSIYYVKILPGGKPLRYGMKGGGIYTDRQQALNCMERLQRHGSKCVLFSSLTDWVQVYGV